MAWEHWYFPPLCTNSWTWNLIFVEFCLHSPIKHTQTRLVNWPFCSQHCLVWAGRDCYHFSAFLFLQVLHAHLAAADASPELPRLESLGGRSADKLLLLLHRGQPEAILVGKVVARSPGTVALDEGSGSEILQAGTRGDEGLASALRPGRRVLEPRWQTEWAQSNRR